MTRGADADRDVEPGAAQTAGPKTQLRREKRERVLRESNPDHTGTLLRTGLRTQPAQIRHPPTWLVAIAHIGCEAPLRVDRGVGNRAAELLLLVQLKVSAGIAARELGAEAERWTADELDKLDPRQWKVFRDVPVRWGNVDHVAVGPGRVYAIETKFTTAKGRFREGFAQQAAKQATRLSELSSQGVHRQVVPLLVIWGNGVADTLKHKPELDKSSRTRILAGATATDWLERMSKAADRFTVDWSATRAVRTLVAVEVLR